MAKDISLSEAVSLSIQYLKGRKAEGHHCDFYAQNAAQQAATDFGVRPENRMEVVARQYWGVFAEAGWVLCTRGILRPGMRTSDSFHSVEAGYSLTTAGKEKLAELDTTTVLVMQSDSLSRTFEGFKSRFGGGFRQKALEAVNCRDCGAIVASCTMAGAAAEAVLLATAIAKTGDESEVLRRYKAANGRRNILTLVTGSAKEHLKAGLKESTGIISMWRDEAAHGTESPITIANADEALRQLLHLCQWVEKNWVGLTEAT